MTELSVPADQVQADGGAFLITMPGDPCSCEGEVRAGEHLIGCRFEWPPSVLVALNQPCSTCDGGEVHCRNCGSKDARWWGTDGHGGREWIRCGQHYQSKKHPDCGGSGRLVFDLNTPCGACHDDEGEDIGSFVPPCEPCGDTGTVTYRVWLDPEWGIRQTESGYVARAVRSDRTGTGTTPDTGDATGSPSTAGGLRRTLGNGRVPQPRDRVSPPAPSPTAPPDPFVATRDRPPGHHD